MVYSDTVQVTKQNTKSKTGGEIMGYRIKERREALKMSQEELSEKSGVSRGTIVKLEKEEKPNTTAGTLLKLAKALDTTVEKLFF